jgi:23S rRNA pseudouridine1911/1915/1917 synthase
VSDGASDDACARTFAVGSAEGGQRLDKVAAARLGISRSAVQRLISEHSVLVDGSPSAASHKVREGEHVEARLAKAEPEQEDIPIPLVFEDEHVLVIDKPAGLVVHPGAGNQTGTLVNALLARGIHGGDDSLRPGIVHRLDRDTSGLMVVARSEEAYRGLVVELSARRVQRIYRALAVGGGLPATGTIDSPVGRDPDNPTLMAVGVGKKAVTHFELLREAAGHSMLRVRLETGRTHQIRVHLAAIDHPVYADPLYGKPVPTRRLWLHAESLGFTHPVTGEDVQFRSPLPKDLREAARRLDASFDL